MNEQIISLPISGITSVNCAMNIEKAFAKLTGINESSVNFVSEQGKFVFDPTRLIH